MGPQDKWTIFGLITCMEQMGVRMSLLQAQVVTVASAPVVDLTREEEEGGLGGPIDLGSPLLYRTPSPLELDKVTAGVIEALGRNWEFLTTGEEATSGDHTPMGLCRSPKL